MSKNELICRINKNMGKLSKGQRLIANYVLENYDKAVYITAAKLGNIVGVSESTVVRFATELGYDGYPKFQEALEELVKSKLTTLQRLEVARNRIDKDHVLKSILQIDEDKIRYTREEIDEKVFNAAVDKIIEAKKIYILGVRSCAGIASFLSFYFNLIFDNIKLINTNSVSEMFESVYRIDENDVIIGISFPRYSKRVLKALEYARTQNASVIAITDSAVSPLANYANYLLTANSEMISFVDSLVAPLSIINAIIVAISLKKKDEIESNLNNLEKIWRDNDVYENDVYENDVYENDMHDNEVKKETI